MTRDNQRQTVTEGAVPTARRAHQLHIIVVGGACHYWVCKLLDCGEDGIAMHLECVQCKKKSNHVRVHANLIEGFWELTLALSTLKVLQHMLPGQDGGDEFVATFGS